MHHKTLYNEYVTKNKGVNTICQEHGLTKWEVRNLLIKYNIPLKPQGGYKRFFHNEDYFKTWSHNMAYCLGFISADGHIWKNRPILDIGLHPQDKQILKFIKDEISPNSIVRYRDPRCVRWLITSKTIVNDLNKYNVNNKKTYNLKIDFNIPTKYWGDYLRGFFDGDGSVYSVKDKRNESLNRYYLRSEFSGASKQMLLDIKNKLGFGCIRKIKKANTYRLYFSHYASKKLYDIMYNGNICLERKRLKFIDAKIS